MGEFFKPWRQKLGVVTLVTACVFMGGWMRSLSGTDVFWFPVGNQTYDRFGSGAGKICWGRFYELGLVYMPTMEVGWSDISKPDYSKIPWPMDWNMLHHPFVEDSIWIRWSWTWCEFGVYEAEVNSQTPVIVKELMLPYWSIVIPLTLLSVYLLFSKPRKSTEKKTADPIP